MIPQGLLNSPGPLPAVLRAVGVRLDEAVPGQRAQVVAARGRGQPGHVRAAGRGRRAVEDQVLFDSDAGVNLAPEHRRVGYIFQDARLFPHMSVESNLLYGFKLADETARTRP